MARVLDRKRVQIELFAQLLELGVRGVLERDPDEAARSPEIAMDLAQLDLGELAAFLIRDAIDEHGDGGFFGPGWYSDTIGSCPKSANAPRAWEPRTPSSCLPK
jgi:hypothetical protein